MRSAAWARWALLTLVAVGALLLASSLRSGARGTTGAPDTYTRAPAAQPALFYDEAAFLDAARDAPNVPPPRGEVIGGIIPHHLLPGYLINGFFRGLAASPPSTVVLIGPNHDNEGRARILTSDLSWDTPFGAVESDRALIDALTSSGLAAVDNTVLASEHSVAGIMPALKYELPAARVVPLILSGDTSPAEARQLGEALASSWRPGTIFVAPVDFSHYLIRREAERRDAVTLRLLYDSDAAALFTLDSQYLDSPPSIAALIETMRALGAGGFVLQANTNSGAPLHDDFVPTTSYFVGYYSLDRAPLAGRAP